MRRAFIECKDRRTAKARCPWAGVITKVCGGFMCFENSEDYETWRRQK